jgi:hypothetical protein
VDSCCLSVNRIDQIGGHLALPEGLGMEKCFDLTVGIQDPFEELEVISCFGFVNWEKPGSALHSS